jgi:hypothetical protein
MSVIGVVVVKPAAGPSDSSYCDDDVYCAARMSEQPEIFHGAVRPDKRRRTESMYSRGTSQQQSSSWDTCRGGLFKSVVCLDRPLFVTTVTPAGRLMALAVAELFLRSAIIIMVL